MFKTSMEKSRVLHIVMFPWLGMGHIIPFFNLSIKLAENGHEIWFVSTPRNLKKLPKIPPNLFSLINLVTLSLPQVDPLPDYAESSTDIPARQAQFLKKAYDLLEPPLTTFLESITPDWIIYDYASHWLPSIAAKLGISRAYLSLFTATFLAFIGPPSVILNAGEDTFRSAPEDFTVVPNWIPFESKIKYRLHEAIKALESAGGNESGTPDLIRFGITIDESDVVVIRSCTAFEPEWFDLLNKLYKKPVLPLGFLPPLMDDYEEIDENWIHIKDWLDKQRLNSVIYAALGSEAVVSREELTELALGLERSNVPFIFVLRKLPWMNQDEQEILPIGFNERVNDRAIVHMGWAPQVKILSHDSVGGFLTHGGWNSVVEGLGNGRAMVLFPVMNDQALNARALIEKGLGVEVEWDEGRGLRTSDSVAETVRLAMVDREGELLRENAKKMKGVFGDGDLNDRYVDGFVRYLEENRTFVATCL